MRQLIRVIATVVALFITVNARALVIDSVDTPVAFTISGDIGDGVLLTATGTVTVTGGFNSSSLAMQVTVDNVSTLNGDPFTPTDGVVLTAWGFGVDPNMTGITFLDSSDGGMIDAKAYSDAGFGGIEVCAWGGNSCSGNSAGGVLAGASDSFQLLLDGNWGSSVTFDPIGARFRTADGVVHSYECSGTACSVGSLRAQEQVVPEPQTLLLLALTLLPMAGTFRYHRQLNTRRG